MIIDELVAVLGYDLRGEGDLRKFEQGMDRAERGAQGFAATLTKLAGVAAAALGGLAIGNKLGQFIGDITNTGAAFEEMGVRLKALEGSSDGAEKALDWITDFATRTPLELAEVVDSYALMRTYGLDPTNGSLQAVTDSMAATGGGAAKLNGVITGLGQAWTKQKLQGEEIMQLLERGIPVWDMLAKATGKSVPELQKLSSAGKLGRKEIALLIDQIGAKYQGASEEYAKTFAGITSNLKDNWTKFLKGIADAGYYDDVKRRLQGLLDFVNRGWESGAFGDIARGLSGGLIDTMDTISHLAAQAYRVGRGFYFAAAGVIDLTSRVTGLSKTMSAAGLGVGLLASSALGRGALMAVARRVPFVAAALAIDDIISGLNGDKSLVGSTAEGQAALDGLKEKFGQLETAARDFADSLGGLGEKIVTAFDLPPEALSNLDDLKVRWDGLKADFGGTWKIGELEMNADPAFDSVETWAKDATTRFKTFFSDPMQGAMLLLIDGINRIATGLEKLAVALNILASPMESVQGALDWIDDKTGNSTQRQSERRQELLRPPPRGGIAGDKAGRLGGTSGDRVSTAFDVTGAGGTSGFNAAQVAQGLKNLQAHIQAMGAKEVNQSIQSTIAPQDNRQFPVTVNSTVNQTVQQASQAPAAAARATSAAIGQAAVQSRPQVAQSAAAP